MISAALGRADVPEVLRVSAIPDENPTELLRIYTPFAEYLARELGVKVQFMPHGVTANLLYLAYALILSNRHGSGLEALGRAIHHQIAFMPQWTRYGTVTAGAYLAAGRIAEATGEVDKGLAMVTERHARGYRGPLLRLQAEVLMQQEPLDAETAGERLREALALTTELGMRPEIARCRLGLARLHCRIGGSAAGAEHLAAAVALFRELGATFWAERAEAEGSEPG